MEMQLPKTVRFTTTKRSDRKPSPVRTPEGRHHRFTYRRDRSPEKPESSTQERSRYSADNRSRSGYHTSDRSSRSDDDHRHRSGYYSDNRPQYSGYRSSGDNHPPHSGYHSDIRRQQTGYHSDDHRQKEGNPSYRRPVESRKPSSKPITVEMVSKAIDDQQKKAKSAYNHPKDDYKQRESSTPEVPSLSSSGDDAREKRKIEYNHPKDDCKRSRRDREMLSPLRNSGSMEEQRRANMCRYPECSHEYKPKAKCKWKHIVVGHLPWFAALHFDHPEVVGRSSLTELWVGLLSLITSQLQLPNEQALLQRVLDGRWFPDPRVNREGIRESDRRLAEEITLHGTFEVVPFISDRPPNCIAALVSISILSNILERLTPEGRALVRNFARDRRDELLLR